MDSEKHSKHHGPDSPREAEGSAGLVGGDVKFPKVLSFNTQRFHDRNVIFDTRVRFRIRGIQWNLVNDELAFLCEMRWNNLIDFYLCFSLSMLTIDSTASVWRSF